MQKSRLAFAVAGVALIAGAFSLPAVAAAQTDDIHHRVMHRTPSCGRQQRPDRQEARLSRAGRRRSRSFPRPHPDHHGAGGDRRHDRQPAVPVGRNRVSAERQRSARAGRRAGLRRPADRGIPVRRGQRRFRRAAGLLLLIDLRAAGARRSPQLDLRRRQISHRARPLSWAPSRRLLGAWLKPAPSRSISAVAADGPLRPPEDL